MFLAYSMLYVAGLIFLFIPQYLKRPSELRKRWVKEKFGSPDIPAGIADFRPVWIHAVSVGEVNAAVPFMLKLRASYPDIPLILSTITDTGQKVAKQKCPAGTSVVYLPFDLGFILSKCFRKIRPSLLVVMETEIWPNLFRIADKNNIPVIVLNGRISERSARGYRRISSFIRKVIKPVTIFCMQSSADAERIKSLGAEAGRVMMLGNFKFDMEISGIVPGWLNKVKGPVIVAGSTHAGEEQLIIDAYRENVYLFPGLKLIIAPRHPERFTEAEEVIRKSDIRYIKRSDIGSEELTSESLKFSILLLDTVGELTSVYSIADIAIMGKSFESTGGQNPLEPAYWGKPIICGPHMENFPFIREFISASAAFEVTSTGLAKKIKELLMQPEKAKAAGEKARSLFLKNSGAVDRAIKQVDVLLRASKE